MDASGKWNSNNSYSARAPPLRSPFRSRVSHSIETFVFVLSFHLQVFICLLGRWHTFCVTGLCVCVIRFYNLMLNISLAMLNRSSCLVSNSHTHRTIARKREREQQTLFAWFTIKFPSISFCLGVWLVSCTLNANVLKAARPRQSCALTHVNKWKWSHSQAWWSGQHSPCRN